MLASMTVDGDRLACERLGAPWPMLSGEGEAFDARRAAVREVLTEAWKQTIAMIMPSTSLGKWSAPTMAIGSAAAGKGMVFLAVRRARGRGAAPAERSPRAGADDNGRSEVEDMAIEDANAEGTPWAA